LLKQEYTHQKEARINSLKQKLNSYKPSENQSAFNVCQQLVTEYQSFQYDSAFQYSLAATKYALLTGQGTLIVSAKIKQGFVLLSSGLFKEAIDILGSVSPTGHPDSIRLDYYTTTARAYFDLADFVNNPQFTPNYRNIGISYLDTALFITSISTPEYWAIESLKRLQKHDLPGAIEAYSTWMNKFNLPPQQFAIAASSLGHIYSIINQCDKAIEYLVMATIADVQASTYETVALRNLSNLLYQKGYKKAAYTYIKMALEDATHFNARHRKIEIASIMPIIEGERLAIVEKQKTKLLNYAWIITILAIAIILFLLVIYRQLNQIKRAKQIISETNQHLREINNTLLEANAIKEEYIGHFFNVNAEYIERIDNYKKLIHRKIRMQQFDDLGELIKSADLMHEREELYRNFDNIFLKLFPNFIIEFNTLFNPSDCNIPKPNELLSAEQRIFALMRLGIKDNDKIAKFLNYSVSTIYTYKTKIKAKSNFRDDFEERIMKIKAI
jgi:tetratricopeptide (TPR) repeat protein